MVEEGEEGEREIHDFISGLGVCEKMKGRFSNTREEEGLVTLEK